MHYLNPSWTDADGGALQIWDTVPLNDPNAPLIRYADYVGRKLDFLVGARQLNLEVGGINCIETVHASLQDIFVLSYSRLASLNFVNEPCYQPVTPTLAKYRKGIVQWLYQYALISPRTQLLW